MKQIFKDYCRTNFAPQYLRPPPLTSVLYIFSCFFVNNFKMAAGTVFNNKFVHLLSGLLIVFLNHFEKKFTFYKNFYGHALPLT